MNKFKCEHCDKEFHKKQQLGGHIVWCKLNPNRSGKSGLDNYNKNRELYEKGVPYERESRPVLCEECGKTFSQFGIATHQWRVHGEGKNKTSNKVPWNKGLNKSDPRVKKYAEGISKSTKGKPSNYVWTDEKRKEQSERKKKLYQEHPEKHPNRKLSNNKNKWTYPEKVAGEWFDKNNLLYERNKRVDKYYPDFVLGNVIVEIDGEYWHDQEKDKERDEKLSELGYTIHRIKAKERIEDRLENIFNQSASSAAA